MLIEPKIRGFICTTAHPTGCAAQVLEQIKFVQTHATSTEKKPKRVLIIGASTGYGLASRIVSAFGMHAETIGVFFERPASGARTASAGWYNTAAFEKEAHAQGLYAKSINGDAFSDDIKQKTLSLIQDEWGGDVDLVIYSVASPRRVHPNTGVIYNSVLKPVGAAFTGKTVNVMTGDVSDVTLMPATDDEIENTTQVMGGEDWSLWIEALLEKKLLAKNAMTVAYSYIGPDMTYAIYRSGTIGHAKEDLEKTAKILDQKLSAHCNGHAYVSVNKALVTQASAAIPIVPLYISLLYRVMKNKKIHEGCIEQIYRLFFQRLYTDHFILLDEKNRIRLDDLEMRSDVQVAVADLWNTVNTDNLEKISDIAGYRLDFYQLFGFEFKGVSYDQAVSAEVGIPSIEG